MKGFYLLTAVFVVIALGPLRAAQPPSDPKGTQDEKPVDKPAAESPAMPSLIEKLPDYSGELAKRSFLLGDWGGTRTKLAEKGVLVDLRLNQYLQGNTHGGVDTNNAARYSGDWDLHLKFDTARLGLWPAGLLELHAESSFGDFANDEAGSPVNDEALYPWPGDRDVMLSHLVYTQALAEWFAVFGGKLDTSVGDKNEFAWLHGDNFMHTSFRWNPVAARTTPYSTLGAGFAVLGKWGQWSAMVYDTEGTPHVSGFDTVFDGGTSVATELALNVRPFDKPGHQTVSFLWSDKNFISLEQDPRAGIALNRMPLLNLLLAGLTLERESSSWAALYSFDQYLYMEDEPSKQGVGLFGRFGFSDGEANPIEAFYSFGVGGKGIIPDRDNDKFGVGYFFTDYSGDLPDLLGISSSQGVELFYNIEATPWLHITPDLQFIVDPGGHDDRDVAIVYGIRAQVSF